jgi:hypothetical protein
MRVNRRLIYAGIFLVGIGGVLVAVDQGVIDTAALADTVRLWPLAVIAIGLSLVLRRTQLSFPSGMLAAAIPGLVLGGAVGLAPRYAANCGARGATASVASEQGTFDGSASVSVSTGCGSLVVGTAPGSAWRFAAGSTVGNSAGHVPSVRSGPQSLAIDAGSEDGHFDVGSRDAWDLTLPTSSLDSVSIVANANRTLVLLPGAKIGRLAVTANASAILIDASAASIANLSTAVNTGSLSITLPAGSDSVGVLRLGGGNLEICAPQGLGMRVTSSSGPRLVLVDGQQQSGSVWENADYASAAHHADLQIKVNFGTVQINPNGGCK